MVSIVIEFQFPECSVIQDVYLRSQAGTTASGFAMGNRVGSQATTRRRLRRRMFERGT